jgi:photosystem II stability/assembly factor-like uncharacterized protein
MEETMARTTLRGLLTSAIDAVPGTAMLVAVLASALAGCSPFQFQPNIKNGGRAVAASVAPGDSSRIVVASASGGIFRTTDTGATWTQASGNGTFFFTDVKYLPSNANIVIATAAADTRTSTGGGIWRSTNGGTSWSRVAVTTPVAACAADLSGFGLAAETVRNRLWAATSCGVAFSTDSGTTWRFLPKATGYDNDRSYAVLAPTTARLAILTDSGVKVSTNAGGSWSLSTSGLTDFFVRGVHNAIAVSPLNPAHLFLTTGRWIWNPSAATWEGHTLLYRSWDNGATWTALQDLPGLNRPAFVRTAQPSDATHYTIHFGDGGCTQESATVTNAAIPTVSGWTASALDHCDTSDLAFSGSDGRTPLLLTSDGGLHRTADAGAHWTLTGGGAGGYDALQITEVTGQLHPGRRNSDLYFATQDNFIWASGDAGVTWPTNVCCEGFFLNIWRQPLPADQTRLTGVDCGACFNFISGPLLAGFGGFPNPPNDAGNPRLLKPGTYVQNTRVTGLAGNIFDLTTNTGASWTPRYAFPEDPQDLPKVAGPVANPVIYTAIKLSGARPDGSPILGLKRVADTLAAGSPVLSNIGGIGSLGIFATEFAWYKPFGVDPLDANFLIVPDIDSNTVKVSGDAGATWATDFALSNLATRGGTFKFSFGPFSQISSFGFDPDCAGHILVGTQQAGIMETFNRGATWSVLPGSDFIPLVSCFYFQGSSQVLISSYGRGLWKHVYSCPRRFFPGTSVAVLAEPTIYWKGAKVPLSQIHDPDVCPVCGYFITEGGDILDYTLDAQTGEVREVALSGGSIRGLTYQRQPVAAPFQVRHAERLGKLGGDRGLRAQLKAGARIKGLYLDGAILKGVILAEREVQEQALPRKVALGPYVRVEVRQEENPNGAGQLLVVLLRGSGFDPNRPLSVSIDGKRVKLQVPQGFDTNRNFTLPLPPVVGPGGHTVLVEQQGPQGTLRDAATFIIPLLDTGEESAR